MAERQESLLRFSVTAEEAGMRLDQLLALRIAEQSRSQLAARVREGLVTLAGLAVKPSVRVSEGEEVCYRRIAPPPSELVPEPVDFGLVYEDEELVVVDKPAGVIVHPGAGQPTGSLVHGLLNRLGSTGLSPIGAPTRPGIVHRIDQQTSGLLVVARTERTHHALAEQFSTHSVGRRYLAIVWDPQQQLAERGTLEGVHGRDPHHRLRFTCRRSPGDGRRAVTHWIRLERLPPLALVVLRLETGRTHQIRVHMSEAGYPLVGDPLYGRKQKLNALPTLGHELGLKRQALHAHTLSFFHPTRREELSFSAPLPPALRRPWTQLRRALWGDLEAADLPDLGGTL